MSGWLHSAEHAKKQSASGRIGEGRNQGARNEERGRNSLFEGELVIGFLDLRRVRVLLNPGRATILEREKEPRNKGMNGGEQEADVTREGRSSRLRRSRWHL